MLFDDNFAGLAMFALVALMAISYKFGEFVAEYRQELEATRRRHATTKRKTAEWYLQELNQTNRKGN